MADGGEPAAGRHDLAGKLNYLFAMVRPGDGEREYTGREVTEAARERGTELSQSHLSELRRGVKSNPTVRVLQVLADFFQVRVGYFFDDPAAVDEVESELRLRQAMRDARVHDVAFRVAGLSPDQRSAMYRLLTSVLDERNEAGEAPGGADGAASSR